MREIKFRAWDKDRRKMFYPGYIVDITCDGQEYECKGFHSTENHPRVKNRSRWIPGEKTILMQYTGLKGKNGKEIYEGDIIKKYNSFYVVKFGKQDIGHDFQGIGFYLSDINVIPFNEPCNIYDECGIIVGNIYEDGELLDKPNQSDKIEDNKEIK